MSNEETVFAQGMFIQERKPSTPDWVLGKFSFKADEFINTLNQYRNESGFVNVVMKKSKAGKPYLALDLWKPTPQGGQQAQPANVPQSAGPQGAQPAFNNQF